MKKLLFLFLSVLTAVLFQGCTLADQSCSMYQPLAWGVIGPNRAHLRKLRIGMTRAEVTAVMGKPSKVYSFNSSNIWWYYTKMRVMDLQVTRDECTPLVFGEDGTLAGFGKEYYRENVHDNLLSADRIRQALR